MAPKINKAEGAKDNNQLATGPAITKTKTKTKTNTPSFKGAAAAVIAANALAGDKGTTAKVVHGFTANVNAAVAAHKLAKKVKEKKAEEAVSTGNTNTKETSPSGLKRQDASANLFEKSLKQ